MITKFKIFEGKKDTLLYHYTTLENAKKILNEGELKVKERSFLNKYSSIAVDQYDYGYISLTEDEELHFTTNDLPTDLRFVFSKKKLEKEYELVPFNYDEEKQKSLEFEYGEMSDLDYANEEWYGDESELRVHQNIPIKNILYIEMIEENSDDELKELCQKNNIELNDNEI